MSRKNRGYQDLIRAIKEDNLSGASLLSRKAANTISLFTQEIKAKTISRYYQSLLEVGKELISAQPDMIPIFNLVNSILLIVEKKKNKLTLEELNYQVRKKVEDFHSNSLKSLEGITQIGQTLIFNGCTVITYSFSEGVFSILKKAKEKRKRFKVVLSESRPVFEGKNLALSLGKMGIPVTLVIDAALSLYLKEVDLVLVGADSVSERSFVNKVGTYGLSLMAKELGVPFYVASERTKFISEKWSKTTEHHADPKEIFSKRSKNVKIENPYFEEIPLLYCKKIITPDGFISPSRVSSEIRKITISKDLMKEIKGIK
ncbi:MAG: translation initiation factor eIF-2B [Candidatus Zixiibacteriota bacterium]